MLALYLHLGPFADFVQHEIGLQIEHIEKTGHSNRELYNMKISGIRSGNAAYINSRPDPVS